MIKKRTKITYLLVIITFFWTSGCSYVQERLKAGLGPQHLTTNFYLYPDFNTLDINTVAIAQFQNSSDIDQIEKKVRDIFTQELKKTKRFEITDSQNVANNKDKFKIGGTYTEKDMLEIARKTHIDGLILGEITQYLPYKPLVLGVKLKMIQTITGEEVWLIDEVYDTSLSTVSNRAKEYYFRKIDPKHSLQKWELVINSMQYFTQFVCFEIVNTFAGA